VIRHHRSVLLVVSALVVGRIYLRRSTLRLRGVQGDCVHHATSPPAGSVDVVALLAL